MHNEKCRPTLPGVTIACAAALLAFAGGPASLRAQAYPEKPIRLVVPSPPGGGTDTLSRMIAAKLGETRNWQFLVDNRPGAGGNIGIDIVAKSPPDGYTIALGESSNLTINPYLYSKLVFDPAKDVTPVVFVGTVPLVLVTSPARRWDRVASVVSAAKEKPLTFASGGNGTVGHLAGEIWMRRVGVTLHHIPYRGGGPAVTDVMGGQVDLHFASVPAAAALIESGKLQALAVTSSKRAEQLPAVPTFDEAGYTGFVAQVIYGFVAPAGTPAAVVARLNAEINGVLQAPDVKENLTRIGVEIRGGTPEDFATFLIDERAKWQRAVADSGARVD
jgi:tripartite-type tricarboxylate transporter receptor subunit TctC